MHAPSPLLRPARTPYPAVRGPEIVQFQMRTNRAWCARPCCDDVLFALARVEQPLAVVHLAWPTTQTGTAPPFPATTFYPSVETWVEQCMKPEHGVDL